MKVFVYGTLKRNKTRHDFLKHAAFIGEDTISGYGLYGHKKADYPFACVDDDTLQGEVYEVNDVKLSILIQIEVFPDLFGMDLVETKYGHAIIFVCRNKHNLYLYKMKRNSW